MANELRHKTVGEQLTQAEFEAVGLHVLNSQATGDLIIATSATQLSRLAKITTGQYLKATATGYEGATPATGATLTLCNTEVYNATPTEDVWTDLDLSAIVGANPAVVFLRIYSPYAGGQYFNTRPNGETEAMSYSPGMCWGILLNEGEFGITMGITDSAGIIEFHASRTNPSNITIDIIGYIN